MELDIFVNGSRGRAISEATPTANGHAMMTGCRPIRLSANDEVDVRVYQYAGATVQFSDDDNWIG